MFSLSSVADACRESGLMFRALAARASNLFSFVPHRFILGLGPWGLGFDPPPFCFAKQIFCSLSYSRQVLTLAGMVVLVQIWKIMLAYGRGDGGVLAFFLLQVKGCRLQVTGYKLQVKG